MGATPKINILAGKGLFWIFRRRVLVWIALGILLLLAAFSAAMLGNYSNDPRQLFPHGSISGNMFRVTAKSRLGDSIQLEFDSGQPGGAPALAAAAETLADRLSSWPEIAAVDFKISVGGISALSEFAAVLPLLHDASILETASSEQAVQKARKAFMLPAAPVSTLRFDPFGWNSQFLLKLRSLQQLSGLKISLQHPFMTDDRAERLLLNLHLEMPQPLDAQGIAEFLQRIRSEAAELLPSAKLTIISPLVHSMENEQTIRSDIFKISLTSMLALLLLFFLIYRGALDAVWIPLLPFASSIIVTGIMAAFFQNICLLVLGTSGSIAGLAVDQGIHCYTAFTGKQRFKKLAGIFLPLSLCALTSAAVFLTLVFSGIEAYLQLGLFSGCILLINLLLSFFILPTLLKKRRVLHFPFASFRPTMGVARVITGLWLLLCIAAAMLLPSSKLDFNLSALDGTSTETLQAEKTFQQRWRTDGAGDMIVITGSAQQEILERCESLETELALSGQCFHPATLCPSRQKQQENLDSWRRPDTARRLQELQERLSRECQQAGLPPAFYELFFQALQEGIKSGLEGEAPPFLQEISGRLIRRQRDTTTGLFFFAKPQDEAKLLSLLRTLDATGNSAWLSNEAFRLASITDLKPILTRGLLLACIAVLVLLLPVCRTPWKLCIIFLPGLTAALWFSGLLSAFDLPINLASCFGMIILIGLVVDYGIFALHNSFSDSSTSVPTAVFLSALTTLFTSGALLFSSHPVLFHTGLVLFCEILFSAITALYVVPALVKVFGKKPASSALLVALCLSAFVSGCRSYPRDTFAPRYLDGAKAAKEWQAFHAAHNRAGTQLLNMKVDILWYSFPMLLALQKEPATRQITATGMLPSGAMLFSVNGSNGQELSKTVAEVFPEIAKRKIFGSIYEDLCNIFLTGPQEWSFPATTSTPLRRQLPNGEQQSLDGSPLRLVQKRSGTFPNREWIVYYSGWNAEMTTCTEIIYRNFRTGCTFTFRLPRRPQ
jgi:predicted exporter